MQHRHEGGLNRREHGHSYGSNTHGHSNGGIHVSRYSDSRHFHGHGYRNHGFFYPAEEICCLGLFTGLACVSPQFAKACLIGILAVAVVICLATLAMSVTAEALLSVLLIGMVIYGVASLCRANNCCEPTNDYSYESTYTQGR